MPEPGAQVPSPEPRVSTGNPELDTMLEGGLVARRPYLIVGASGTGKSTLALQFLCEGVRHGERVLLVTLEEPPNECRINHRGLFPELEQVEVFDAIPDIMRYERVPFKDIASVRSAIPFKTVPARIRRTPELSSVEVTITALEQMLRSEVTRKGYTRIVVDSLTALQYFCMKGFEPVAGAQTFLRFLSDLQVTTVLTVESPLEDVDTAERMLARGEIRLFRWELDGLTVRAIGVEKFRGSSHDVRLHPYRIGPQGIDVNLSVTISRDTRQIVQPPIVVTTTVAPAPVSPMASLEEEVRDFVLIGAPLGPLRAALAAALAASFRADRALAERCLADADALTKDLAASVRDGAGESVPIGPGAGEAYQRIRTRAESIRLGVGPTQLPELNVLKEEVARVLALIPPPVAPAPEPEEKPPARTPPKETPRARTPRSAEPPVAPVPAPPPVAPPPPPPPPPPEPTPAPPVSEPPAAEPPAPEPTAVPEPLPVAAPPEPAPVAPIPPPPPLELPPPPAVPAPAADHPSPVPGVAPRSRLRGEPPPLPVVTPAPVTGASPAPIEPPGSTPAPELPPTPEPSTSSPAPGLLAAPAPTPAPALAAAPATRKKKRSSTTRRKAPPEGPTETRSPEPGGVPADAPPFSPPLPSPPTAEATPAEEKPPPTKPKRRAPRKRKAPPVVAATAGEIPTEELGSPPASGSPPADPPPKDGAP